MKDSISLAIQMAKENIFGKMGFNLWVYLVTAIEKD